MSFILRAFSSQWSQALARRRKAGLYRSRPVLSSPQGPEVVAGGRRYLSFCSNDYLGLANHPDIVQSFKNAADSYGVGSGASHLVSGHSAAHHALEEELAEFTGRQRALLFSSGYMANVGVITTLAGKEDNVFEDRLNHASLLDGGLFCGARFRRFPHRDTERLRVLLARAGGRTLVVSDGVFSMDGDMAPLPELMESVRDSGALLMLDDAHGFGCLAEDGTGSAGYWRERGHDTGEENCQVLVGTLGKAFGTSGAFVAGSEDLVEMLVQFCRPYIYTTAMSPALAEATRTSLGIVRRETWRREYLRELIERFRRSCAGLGFTLTDSPTPVQAIILGDAEDAMAAADFLREQGIFVTAIRPPTVPRGTARLRLTFSAAHDREHFDRLLDALEHLAARLHSGK